MAADINTKINLAREFGSRIQEALSVAEFTSMIDRNKAEPAGSPVCHSHDFLDANVMMLEAWEDVFGGEPDASSDVDTEIMNDAWAIAKAASFFA